MAFFNQFLFLFGETHNAIPRLPTALAGIGVVVGPLLWRSVLGRVNAIILALLLALSPVAMTSARLMGGVTWTMLLVFVGGWLAIRFWETNQQSYGVAATMSAGAMILLAEPTGLITFIGVLIGLTVAMLSRYRLALDESPLTDVLRRWPWSEGLVATLLLLMVVGTGLFTASGNLASVGTTLVDLIENFNTHPADTPAAFALLVALRYEFGIVLIGLLALWLAFREGDTLAQFFGGWLIWGIFVAAVYGNPTPDAALWVTVPAAGLTALVITRTLQSSSSGFWYVPRWGVPLHAVISTLILVALAINVLILGRATQQDARPVGIELIDGRFNTSAAKIGSVNAQIPETTMQLNVPPAVEGQQTTQILTVQVVPITDGFVPQLTITNSLGELISEPIVYDPDEGRGIIQELELPRGQDYFFKVFHAGQETLDGTGEFMLLTYGERQDEVFGLQLDLPTIMLLARISPTPLRQQPLIFIPFMLVILVIVYLLAASLWGTRAAWRGLALGVLLYFAGSGVGLGWQASYTFANDVRELWHRQPVASNVERLAETLEQMSLQGTGEPDELEITVLGPDDGALAWALRDFENTVFVKSVGAETDAEAVITSATVRDPDFGADYVGQDFVLREDWNLSDLSWTDFASWLMVRETRLDPRPEETVILWVRNDIYGVQQVITAP
jgi:hypothetical protein